MQKFIYNVTKTYNYDGPKLVPETLKERELDNEAA
jgi:hypothetical protein